jgi:muconate cycloisomerase
MRLIKINLFSCKTPFLLAFKSAHLSRASSDSVLIELAFDNGVTGWGESAPRPYVTGETTVSVVRLIKELFSSILFHNEIDSIQDVENILDLLEQECQSRDIISFRSALGCCDIALLDALGNHTHKHITEFLGPVQRTDIPYSFSVPLAPLSFMVRYKEIIEKTNIKHFKILMAPDPTENYERVHFVRSQFGDSADIRVEANGHWTVGQALANLNRLKDSGISAVEQPVAAHDLEGLQIIRKETGVPVIVDESMCSLNDAEKLISKRACDILNIKISKCGGLLRSKRIADFARSHGVRIQLGAHVGETKILSKAGESFVKTVPEVVCYEGCSPLLFGGTIEQEKSPSPDLRPGLGDHIDKKNLAPMLSIDFR